MSSQLKAVVFDMDGVVIDSEFTHYSAICEAMGEGATASFEQFLEHCTGRDEVYAMSRMAELSGMHFGRGDLQKWGVLKGEAYARLVVEHARPIPGSVELVLSVAQELPVGLATGSRRHDVESALPVLAGGVLNDVFSSIVTSSDVGQPKPHPQTYEKAVEELGVSAPQCWAVEDSPNGIRSASAAGLRVIGVRGTNAEQLLLDAGAERVVDDLMELSLTTLREWFAE
ncbi:MAG: HAD family phosphatase [Opitutae bacterium]|nr:HAD family phosphatase [Opitutae bacterium]